MNKVIDKEKNYYLQSLGLRIRIKYKLICWKQVMVWNEKECFKVLEKKCCLIHYDYSQERLKLKREVKII